MTAITTQSLGGQKEIDTKTIEVIEYTRFSKGNDVKNYPVCLGSLRSLSEF